MMVKQAVNKIGEIIKAISELFPDDIATQFVELGQKGLVNLESELGVDSDGTEDSSMNRETT